MEGDGRILGDGGRESGLGKNWERVEESGRGEEDVKVNGEEWKMLGENWKR